MLYIGKEGADAVLRLYMGDKASGTISLWYIGAGYGDDPRKPGQKILPNAVSASGATAEYAIPSSLLGSWLRHDGQLTFLATFLGNTIDNSKWRAFVRIEQHDEILCARELGKNVNGDSPPYKPVKCGTADSGLVVTHSFTLQLA